MNHITLTLILIFFLFPAQVQAGVAGKSDPAGNSTPPSPPADTAPPRSAITSYPPVLTNSTTAEFTFSSTKPDSTFECSLDGNTLTECTSPLTYTGLSGGSHTFTVSAKDEFNNKETTPSSYAWTIDTTPLITKITDQPPNRTTSTTASFSFTAGKTGAIFQCQLDGGSFLKCSSPMTYSKLTEGNHTFAVKAIDEKGNEDNNPAQATWVIGLPLKNTTMPGFINRKGMYFTGNNIVTLSLSAESKKGITGYFASESPTTPDISDQAWVTFPPVKSYYQEVKYGMSEKTGKKRIYVWFKDSEGNISEVRSDTIRLFNPYYAVITMFAFMAVISL